EIRRGVALLQDRLVGPQKGQSCRSGSELAAFTRLGLHEWAMPQQAERVTAVGCDSPQVFCFLSVSSRPYAFLTKFHSAAVVGQVCRHPISSERIGQAPAILAFSRVFRHI